MIAAKNGEPSPTQEQYLMTLCQTFNCLPSQIMYEDYALINRMLVYTNSYNAVRRSKEATGDKIHRLPASVGSMLDTLEQMGINAKGL